MKTRLLVLILVCFLAAQAKDSTKKSADQSYEAADPSTSNLAETEQLKIGVIDMARVGREASSIQTMLEQVGIAEQSLARLVQTADAELKSLRDKSTPEAEFRKKQTEVQALVDKKVSELQTLKSGFDTKIKADIKKAVDVLVAEKSLELILDKLFVPRGGLDLTDEFISRLQPPAKH